jgi:hypothetical protein
MHNLICRCRRVCPIYFVSKQHNSNKFYKETLYQSSHNPSCCTHKIISEFRFPPNKFYVVIYKYNCVSYAYVYYNFVLFYHVLPTFPFSISISARILYAKRMVSLTQMHALTI